jgi:hypothetical protein
MEDINASHCSASSLHQYIRQNACQFVTFRITWVHATTWKVIREIWGTQKVLFFEINKL